MYVCKMQKTYIGNTESNVGADEVAVVNIPGESRSNYPASEGLHMVGITSCA